MDITYGKRCARVLRTMVAHEADVASYGAVVRLLFSMTSTAAHQLPQPREQRSEARPLSGPISIYNNVGA